MTRLSLVAFLALAFSGVALAAPPASQDIIVADDVHTTASWSYTDCGLSSDPLQITSIKLSPDPPEPGKQLTIRVDGHVAERIDEGAYADVVVKLGLVKLLHKRFDLCEEARNANATVRCPVEKGNYLVEQVVDLPREIPRAKFTVNVRGYTADEEDLVCLDLKVDFMKSPSLE